MLCFYKNTYWHKWENSQCNMGHFTIYSFCGITCFQTNSYINHACLCFYFFTLSPVFFVICEIVKCFLDEVQNSNFSQGCFQLYNNAIHLVCFTMQKWFSRYEYQNSSISSTWKIVEFRISGSIVDLTKQGVHFCQRPVWFSIRTSLRSTTRIIPLFLRV